MRILEYRKSGLKSLIKWFFAGFIFLFLAVAVSPFSAGLSEDLLSSPVKHLESYHFQKGSPLIDRVQTAPDFILKAWMKWDGCSDYRPHPIMDKERHIIGKYLKMLPPLSRDIMKERMVAIYFIDNFLGSGLTDWLVDKNNNIYTYIIFNSKTLKLSLSELITWKERTCFAKDDQSLKLNVEINSPINGFLYILLHESTHIVDYVEHITPFTEPYMKRFMKKKPGNTDFTAGIWWGYSESLKFYPFRKKVTFYGMNNGPRVGISEAVRMYDGLARSPFVSLYGSMNWAEDLAEFMAFYHLTEKMGLKYRLFVRRGEEVIHLSEPLQNWRVRKRFHSLNAFYQPWSFSKKK